MRLILITRVIDLRAISGYRDRRRQLTMAEQYLSCNVRNCGVKLKEKAYVTSCSHTFCVDHGQRAIQNNVSPECIICGTKLDKLYDFMLIDLNPSDQYKSMMLTGLHPDVALEIASRSVSYYIYQLTFDINNKNKVIRQIKRENAEIKEYCQNFSIKYKRDIMKMQSNVKSIEQKLDEKNKDFEAKKLQLVEAHRHIKKLQMQLNMHKRKDVMMKATPVRTERLFFDSNNEIVTPKFNFRHMENHSNHIFIKHEQNPFSAQRNRRKPLF